MLKSHKNTPAAERVWYCWQGNVRSCKV